MGGTTSGDTALGGGCAPPAELPGAEEEARAEDLLLCASSSSAPPPPLPRRTAATASSASSASTSRWCMRAVSSFRCTTSPRCGGRVSGVLSASLPLLAQEDPLNEASSEAGPPSCPARGLVPCRPPLPGSPSCTVTWNGQAGRRQHGWYGRLGGRYEWFGLVDVTDSSGNKRHGRFGGRCGQLSGHYGRFGGCYGHWMDATRGGADVAGSPIGIGWRWV
eukprot:351966-Pyramimonas_sp.AAC.1